MPMVIADRITRKYIRSVYKYNRPSPINKHLFVLRVEEIPRKYEHFCIEGTIVNGYLSRVFNEELEVTMEPKLFVSLDLMKAITEIGKGFYLDFDPLARELSIPDGYYVEMVLTSLENKQYGEKILFPHELKVDVSYKLKRIVNERIDLLRKIGSISESRSLLAEIGLSEIARDLSEGYSRFEMGDYDGAIKAYRKVIEGFRNYLREKETKEGKTVFKRLIDNSEERTKKLIKFLSTTYILLSNFGEHYGTRAFDEEGIFAHKIVESVTEYMIKKLRLLKG